MKYLPTYSRCASVCVVPLFLGFVTVAAVGDDKRSAPIATKHQITGLFAPDREPDLREAFAKIPDIKLVSIDFANAEALLEYDTAKLLPNAKAEQLLPKLDSMLKSASNHTFGIKPLRSVPLDKLKLIEIPVAGLDCKACCLAAYESVYKLEGVERATASFREGRVTALIDPAKTDRTKLEAALKQRGVQVKAP
jgi:copper chaperone CopZ